MLMMFYTTVAGWMILYFVKMARGDFVGLDTAGVAEQFGTLMGQPGVMLAFMGIVVLLGMGVCALGLQNGVEKITKVMMVCLLVILVVLVVRAVTLPGAAAGLEFYLKPDFRHLMYASDGSLRLGEAIFAAMGRPFLPFPWGSGRWPFLEAISVRSSACSARPSMWASWIRLWPLWWAWSFFLRRLPLA